MENDNFWDWENEEEHRVSSVYRDTDAEEETAGVQGDAFQNSVAQTDAVQGTETQNAQVQNTAMQSDGIRNINAEQTYVDAQEVVTESNFILVDNPQGPVQRTDIQTDALNAQTENQQAAYQPKEESRQAGNQQTEYQQTGYQSTEEYQQTEYRQNNFQQIIPVQTTQQSRDANRQKAKHNKNTDYSANLNPKDISENKVSAMAAYLLGPVGIIIALLIARDSAYTAFHVRQALKITICSVVLEVIAAILALFAMIPLVGIIFKLVLVIICAMWLGVLVLRLAAIAQVCDGEAREPVIIGKMNCFH